LTTKKKPNVAQQPIKKAATSKALDWDSDSDLDILNPGQKSAPKAKSSDVIVAAAADVAENKSAAAAAKPEAELKPEAVPTTLTSPIISTEKEQRKTSVPNEEAEKGEESKLRKVVINVNALKPNPTRTLKQIRQQSGAEPDNAKEIQPEKTEEDNPLAIKAIRKEPEPEVKTKVEKEEISTDKKKDKGPPAKKNPFDFNDSDDDDPLIPKKVEKRKHKS